MIKYLLTLFTLSILFSSCGEKKEKENNIENKIEDVQENIVLSEEEKKEKLLEEKKQKEDELISSIQDELKAIEDKNLFNTFRGTQTNLQLELILFDQWAKLIRKSSGSDKKETADLSSKFKKRVESAQSKEFPILRKEYGKLAKELLWEHDIDVSVTGTNNTILNLSGGLFAANKNIKDTQTTLSKVVKEFRFKQVRYRWYKGADEYTYYTVFEGNDKDLYSL